MMEVLQTAAANPALWFILAFLIATILGYERVQKVLLSSYERDKQRIQDLARAVAADIYQKHVRPEKNKDDAAGVGSLTEENKSKYLQKAFKQTRSLLESEGIKPTRQEIIESLETGINELKRSARMAE